MQKFTNFWKRYSGERRIRSIQLSPFWTVFWIIVLVSAVIRLLSFARGLPYITQVDEPNIYYTVQGWRGLFNGAVLKGYPPIILWISLAVQLVTEALGHPGVASTVYAMRLLAVGYSLGTLTLISLTARRIAGDGAALIAGASWGVSTLIAEYSINAQADPFAFLAVASSIFLAVVAVESRNQRYWCVYSFILGLLAVLTKYPLFPVLLPPGLIALYVLLREDRAKGLRFLGLQVILTGAVLLWLSAVYHFQSVAEQTPGLWANFGSGLTTQLIHTFVSNFDLAMQPINPWAVLGAWLLGIVSYSVAGRLNRSRMQIAPVFFVLLAAVLFNVVSSLMTQGDSARWRDVLPATPLICVLFGVAVWQITQVLPAPSARFSCVLRWVPIAAVTGLVFVPQSVNTVDYVRVSRLEPTQLAVRLWAQVSRLEPTQLAVRLWAQVNLDPGWVIVNSAHVRTFNTFFGGIPASKWFSWRVTNTLSEHTPEEWRRMNMQYAALEEWRVRQFEQSSEGRDYMSKMLLLRAFPGLPTYQGLATLFYRLWRPQVETQFNFVDAAFVPQTEISLVGYDLTDRSKHPIIDTSCALVNEYVFTFYWKTLSTPRIDYSVFVHLRPMNADVILAQIDGSPGITERPTSTWNDRSETIIGRSLSLRLPDHLPQGQYRVVVGLYDSATGRRLTTSDGKQEIEIDEFMIN